MLTAEPGIPTRNAIIHCEKPEVLVLEEHNISLQLEHDITNNLTFLCATSEKPETVIALCIEEQIQPDSCIFRILMNTKIPDGLVAGMHSIAHVLENADSRSKQALLTRSPGS